MPRVGPSHAARHGPARVPRGVLIPSTESSSVFMRVSFFDPIFKGSFGGLPELKMGHAAYRRKALDVLFPTV